MSEVYAAAQQKIQIRAHCAPDWQIATRFASGLNLALYESRIWTMKRFGELFSRGYYFLWGIAAILMASFGILFCIVMAAVALFTAVPNKTKLLLESGCFSIAAFGLLYLGIRAAFDTSGEFMNSQIVFFKLAVWRDRFEAWINRERKDV